MKKLLVISIMYSLMMLGEAKASDDVYVDLSVLDNIPQDSIGFVSSEPLFPQVKKSNKPAVAKRKARVVKKTAVKPAKKPAPVKPVVVKEEVNVEIEEQKVVLPVEEENNFATEPQNLIPESATVTSEPQSDNVQATEQTPIEENIVSETQNTQTEYSENKTEEQTQPEEQPQPEETSQPEEQLQPEEISQPVQPTESVNSSEAENTSTPSLNNEETNNDALSAQISEKTKEDNSSNVLRPKEIYSLNFEPDSSELTPETQQKLEKLVQIFDAEHKKKISIKAYNYDNGAESFRKKRISLNRATEVRSFFLNNGFKNFSIKIINTTVDNEYKDTVEIEELD